MNIRMASLVVAVALLSTFTACMNLGTSPSNATRFYLLESRIDKSVSSGAQEGLADLSLAIGPVTIPAYLDRAQIVTRMGGNELRVDEFRHWAEPLKAAISLVIRENLSMLTDAGHVLSYPVKRATVIDYQISLDVLRFDADAAGNVTLKSVWWIVEPDDHQRLMERRSTIVQASGSNDTADVVEAMSMTLAELSREMALVLVELSGRSPGT